MIRVRRGMPLWAMVVGLVVWSVSVDALAFHVSDTFVRSANRGGGSKIFYNGSPRFRGYDCTMCHRESTGGMRALVTSDPPELLEGVYKPLAEYTLTVEMVGERKPAEEESNFNMFVAEIVDDSGKPVGRFEEIELSSLQRVAGDVNIEGAVFGSFDRSRWTFTYTAPTTDTGRIAFHLGSVTGDSGLSQGDGAPSDPFGDDVFVMKQRACEQFVSCDTAFEEPEENLSPVAHGCSVAAAPAMPQDAAPAWLFLALGLMVGKRHWTAKMNHALPTMTNMLPTEPAAVLRDHGPAGALRTGGTPRCVEGTALVQTIDDAGVLVADDVALDLHRGSELAAFD